MAPPLAVDQPEIAYPVFVNAAVASFNVALFPKTNVCVRSEPLPPVPAL